MASLDDLRAELAALDRELLAMVGRRQALAQQIGAVKREAGIPTRDYRQERDVVERAQVTAAAHGVSPGLAAELMLALIRGSLAVQERAGVHAEARGGGRRVLIIGGAGQMGRWFGRFLTAQGYHVEIADPAAVNGRASWRDGALDHDLIVVAAPMPASNQILLELAATPPPGVVFDIGSLKSPLRPGLRALAAAGARVTSLHPMFGPDTELLSGRHVIVVDVGHADANRIARDLFSATMVTLVDMELEDHDRLIAYVLGLSHALNIAFFTALADSGEAAPKLATLSSTTFDAQLHIASKVAAENPDLYFEIQTLNDYGSESLTALLYAVERMRSVVRAGDRDGFRALMTRGDAYLRTRPPR